jgi:acetyltransferase
LVAAAKKIEENFSKSGFIVEEFLIQPFVKAKHELLIGGFRDPSFGPVIMFGSGGKYVEVYDDVVIKSCYLCDDDIEDMIASTKIGRILKGVRGEESINISELKRIIKSCSKMILENDCIVELDLNPLVVDKCNNIYAIDIRIKTD